MLEDFLEIWQWLGIGLFAMLPLMLVIILYYFVKELWNDPLFVPVSIVIGLILWAVIGPYW